MTNDNDEMVMLRAGTMTPAEPDSVGDQLLQLRTVLPIYRGARKLLTERGWGRDNWARHHRLPIAVSGNRVRAKHKLFSLPGALVASARVIYGEGSAAETLVERAFAPCLNGLLSTILCSDVSNETIKMMTMEQRVAIAGHIMMRGDQLQSVAIWNDVTCADGAEALLVMDHTVWLHEQAERQLRSRLQ